MDEYRKPPDLHLFMAAAAHDMKNSVSMLSGTLEYLLSDPSTRLAPEYRQMAHMLYETKRLNNNLIQLLALYKEIGSASFPFDPQPLAMAQFIEDVAAQNQILFDCKGIAFTAETPDELVWNFDEDLVIGVVGNALNNAIHYTDDRVRLAVAKVDGFLEIRVEDNGRGYPPPLLEASMAQNAGVNFLSGSTGLGLYFANVVAQMHTHRGRSGSVMLENGGAWGGGCFVLRLP